LEDISKKREVVEFFENEIAALKIFILFDAKGEKLLKVRMIFYKNIVGGLIVRRRIKVKFYSPDY